MMGKYDGWKTAEEIEQDGICNRSTLNHFCSDYVISSEHKIKENGHWKVSPDVYDVLKKANNFKLRFNYALKHMDEIKALPDDCYSIIDAAKEIGCDRSNLYVYFYQYNIPGIIYVNNQRLLRKALVDECKNTNNLSRLLSQLDITNTDPEAIKVRTQYEAKLETAIKTDDSFDVMETGECDVKITNEQLLYLNKRKATSKEQLLYFYLLANGASYTEMQPLNVKEAAEKLNSMVSAIYSLMSSMDTKHIIYTLHNYTDQLTYRLIKPTQDCYSKMINKPEIPTPTPESKFEPEPESLADPESDPSTPQEPEPSVTSSATIQGHEIRLESVDAFELLTQGYDALHLLKNTIGGRTDKDMTAAYTQLDDICKSLAALRPDIEAINDYTYTLVYLDGSPNPAAFPVRKQTSEGAVA